LKLGFRVPQLQADFSFFKFAAGWDERNVNQCGSMKPIKTLFELWRLLLLVLGMRFRWDNQLSRSAPCIWDPVR
jgi:hypothetical protein